MKKSNLPNILTLSRFAVIPIIMLLLLTPAAWAGVIAGVLIALAGISDFFDGYLARQYEIETDLGKFLDPLADKLLVTASLVMLSALGRVHAILVVIIVGREIFINGLRAIASNEGVVIAAKTVAKYKTVLQIMAVVGLCVHEEYFGLNFHVTGILILYVSIGLSIYSAIEYVRLFFNTIYKQGKPGS